MRRRRSPGLFVCSSPWQQLLFIQLLLIWLFCFSVIRVDKFVAAADNDEFTTSLNVTELDCRWRRLAVSYARYLQPWWLSSSSDTDSDQNDDTDIGSKILQDVKDALQLQALGCHDEEHVDDEMENVLTQSSTAYDDYTKRQWNKAQKARGRGQQQTKAQRSLDETYSCSTTYCIFVLPEQGVQNDNEDTGSDRSSTSTTGSTTNITVATADEALEQSRAWNEPYQTTIVFLAGLHFVGVGMMQPIVLTALDSGLTILGQDSTTTTATWLTGSVALPTHARHWTWHDANQTIQRINLTKTLHSLQPPLPSHSSTASPASQPQPTQPPNLLPSLFGSTEKHTSRRYIRARYPNGQPETDQWGYNSPRRYDTSISGEFVTEWIKPPPHGLIPTFDYVDFRSDDGTGSHRPTKNDSTMALYNVYAAGTGGVCADVWNTNMSSSYWCSNASDGGWAEVDLECAVSGRLQLPVGMLYNSSNDVGRRLSSWQQAAVGGIVHAWHSQSWAMHMFRINEAKAAYSNTSHASSAKFDTTSLAAFMFEPGGGKQGGRNWCRCDQCTYAAPWCGQHEDPPRDNDTRLISGTWMVENVLAELDVPGEYYYNESSGMLYVMMNGTGTGPASIAKDEVDELDNSDNLDDNDELRLSVLSQLIRIQDGAKDITIANLGLRETSSTYMSDWMVPSGGDWSIHKGGALYIENAERVTVQDCTFSRLDGNAVFVAGKTRSVTIRRNQFEWLGESAIAILGNTDGYNATLRDFPMYTVIKGNVMRELGIYEKQSSAVFLSKAAHTTIVNNLMYNLPRAAINLNDMVGGGDVVERNLLFNTCRESGDHGPINSWDRQPFLTNIRNENEASFVPIRRTIAYNLIFANYGASQGLDNDDGSSWYHVNNNVFAYANGFKMDYGGHDSIFEDNLVVGYPHKGNCVGFGSFFAGHAHVVRRNTCLVATSDTDMIQLDECTGDGTAILHDNRYYAPNGVATVQCGWDDQHISFADFQEAYGLEQNSTLQATPETAKKVLDWALQVLFPEQSNEAEDVVAVAF